MTKKEVKKEGYKRIIKEGQNHQEVYDEMKTPKPAFNKVIAAELAKIPSKRSIAEKKYCRKCKF